jgi:hypothetical protein
MQLLNYFLSQQVTYTILTSFLSFPTSDLGLYQLLTRTGSKNVTANTPTANGTAVARYFFNPTNPPSTKISKFIPYNLTMQESDKRIFVT